MIFVLFISTRLVSTTTPARICRGKTLFSILGFDNVSSSIRCLAPNKVVEQELPLLLPWMVSLPLPFLLNENQKLSFPTSLLSLLIDMVFIHSTLELK